MVASNNPAGRIEMTFDVHVACDEEIEQLQTQLATANKKNKQYHTALEKITHDPCHAYEGCTNKICVCPRGIALAAIEDVLKESEVSK